MEETELLNYLKSLSKIEDIIEYNLNNELLLKHLSEVRTELVKNIIEHKLIKLIIKINNENTENTDNKNIENTESTDNVDNIKEEALKGQIRDLSNLLGGEQEINVKDFDPSVFDTFGKGLGSLFSIQPKVDLIKNENKKEILNNNFTFEIKKKI